METIDLKSFITAIINGEDGEGWEFEINYNGTPNEKQMLEDFCNEKKKIKRWDYDWAWSAITDTIHEKLYPTDMTDSFTEKTLNFLIDNKIALGSLCHMQLRDEWLLKIYEKDNRCVEALQTVELRKKKQIETK